MGVKFSEADLAVFSIVGFKPRMEALKKSIRPKLEALGEELGPLLMNQYKREFFAHTAKHLRRTVNPPDETWVALGPEKRGYKAYIYFAFCIGKAGAQARVVMKDESALRGDLGRNLAKNQKFFNAHAADFKKLRDYTKRESDYTARPISDLADFLQASGERLQNVKSATFDAGFEVAPTSARLAQEVLKSFDLLFPFFECGLRPGVTFK